MFRLWYKLCFRPLQCKPLFYSRQEIRKTDSSDYKHFKGEEFEEKREQRGCWVLGRGCLAVKASVGVCFKFFGATRIPLPFFVKRALYHLWTPCVHLLCIHKELFIKSSLMKMKTAPHVDPSLFEIVQKLGLPMLLISSMWNFTPAVGQPLLDENCAGCFHLDDFDSLFMRRKRLAVIVFAEL